MEVIQSDLPFISLGDGPISLENEFFSPGSTSNSSHSLLPHALESDKETHGIVTLTEREKVTVLSNYRQLIKDLLAGDTSVLDAQRLVRNTVTTSLEVTSGIEWPPTDRALIVANHPQDQDYLWLATESHQNSVFSVLQMNAPDCSLDRPWFLSPP